MSLPRFYCVAASDRYNYGDLLFPLVAKYALESCGPCEFNNVAIIESDLSEIGALPTQDYSVFLAPNKMPIKSNILIAGGQVVNSEWTQLLAFINERFVRLFERFKANKLRSKLYYKFNLAREPFPFVISNPETLANNRVFYHAVGGSVPLDKKKSALMQDALEQSAYLTVRDKRTRILLKNKMGLDAPILPDSAMLYSEIRPREHLKRPVEHDYICAQFGYQKSKPNLQTILRKLREVHKFFGMPIGLLSIGNCPGHDDMKVVEWIEEHADFPVFRLKHDHIDDVTAAIAHAKLFIGTSLHGAIISMSYGNPFVAVNKNIKKLDSYTKTWAPQYLKGCVDYQDIARESRVRMKSHVVYKSLVHRQQKMVIDSFKGIYEKALS